MNSKGQKELSLENKVDELKQQLYEEQNKNAFTNAILEGGSLIIWAVNTDLNLISFNQNYFRHFLQKYSDGLVAYENKGRIKSEDSDRFWTRHYQEALTGASTNFEIRIDINGKYSWKEVFLTPIYDTLGEITGISGLAHDITDKMQSKIDLIISEEKFRNIFESFQDLYFRFDFDGKLIMLSPSVVDIIGYTEEEILGMDIIDYYRSNRKTAFLIRKLTASKRVRNFETDLLHKNGRIVHCICNIRIISDDEDTPLYVEGVARDISELKKTHQELERSKEFAERSLKVKERFLANMSHEIRTPLNGIMGMLHLLDDSNLSGKQKQHIKALKGSSEILLNILNDLLDLSKIEAGKMRINKTNIHTRALMNKLELLYHPQAEENGIALNFSIGQHVPKYIFCDETKLIQIYSNLISNSIKFTPEGGTVNVNLTLAERRSNKTNIVLEGSVEDNGIGIDKKDQEKIFSSFTQLDSSSSKSYKGTGLGLHISKKLIKLLKGKLTLESEVGKGSRFTFTFQTKTADNLEAKPNDVSINPTLSYEPLILLVDDNKVNLDLASEILRNAGCKVNTAMRGDEALKRCKTNHYDLILMDIQMPDMDGYETTARIVAECNEAPPVIAMTAYSLDSDEERFADAGMSDFIAKPIKPSILIQKVESWTNKRENSVLKEKDVPQSTLLSDIDMATLETLRKYAGTEVLNETLKEFEKESKKQLIDIARSFKNKDFDVTLNILHALKGNASTLGVEKMAQQAELMEDRLKTKEYYNFEEGLSTLRVLYQSFLNEVENLMN